MKIHIVFAYKTSIRDHVTIEHMSQQLSCHDMQNCELIVLKNTVKTIFTKFELIPHKSVLNWVPVIDGLSTYMSMSRLHATELYH